MQTTEQRFRYQTLELIAPKPSLTSRLRAVFSAVQTAILNLASTNQEPQITATRDRAGELQWRVYDPISGYRSRFSSEHEVRVWLESRYQSS